MDENPKRPPSRDADFLERLSELDRNLGMSGDADASTAVDPWADFAERRRSSAAAPRGSRPLLDLFPPAEEEPPAVEDEPPFEAPDLETASSATRLATLAAAFLLLMAAGASAAAYIFRDELAAILAAWHENP